MAVGNLAAPGRSMTCIRRNEREQTADDARRTTDRASRSSKRHGLTSVACRQLSIGAIALFATATDLPAQGFQVNEHGSCVVGRAGTGVAKSCDDASAIWFNPAGIAGANGWTISLGATIIAASGGFTDDFTQRTTDLDVSPIPVPHLYATYGITDRFAAGLGIYLPYGLGTRWPLDTSLTAVELEASGAFAGRFIGYNSNLRSIYVQPTIAYQVIDWLDVGAGFVYVNGSVDLNQRADLSAFEIPGGGGLTFGSIGIPVRSDFSNANLEAHGATGYGGHFGLTIKPTDRLHIGARYLSSVKLDYSGRVDFEPVATGIVLPPQNPIALADPSGQLNPDAPLPVDLVLIIADLYSEGRPLADSTASTSITMPDQITIGVAYDVTDKLTLLGDWQWVRWSVFDTLTLNFDNAATPTITLVENYKNTNAFRFGAEYVLNPRWTLRGGYLHHGPATPDETVTPLLPESARNEFTAGVGMYLSQTLRLDLAYQYIRQDKRRGRVEEAPPGTPATVVVSNINSGFYSFTAHLFGATVTVRF